MRRELDGKRKQGKYMKITAGGWNGNNEGKKKSQNVSCQSSILTV